MTSSASILSRLRPLGVAALGRRQDWVVPWPRLPRSPGFGWLGPLAVVGSVAVGWLAFAGARGEGAVALGLFVGAASITLMAWSFLLSVRVRAIEPLFGGLDRMYQVHRWAGVLAVLTMFLHVRLEPEIEGGIRGASRSMAGLAEDLAGVAEIVLYVLVGISLIRWFPYRWWRLTHKLLGIPYAFACLHFFAAEKPYANGSAWGWYFGTIMVAGLSAYLARVGWRDLVRRGRAYRVVRAEPRGGTLELELEPGRRPIRHRAGQFAVLKVMERGLSEPHPFTIASSPGSPTLGFFIRDLGDWTERLHREGERLVGSTVLVEGPYGSFEPLPSRGGNVVWIAGGVGITPFLSAIDDLQPAERANRPILVSCVRRAGDAIAIERLRQAEAEGRIVLHVVAADEGSRFSADLLARIVGPAGLVGTHVAVCGPAGLVRSAVGAARDLGARRIETEAFDIRSGVGPDLSRPIDELIGSVLGRSDDQPVGPRTVMEVDEPSNRKPSGSSNHEVTPWRASKMAVSWPANEPQSTVDPPGRVNEAPPSSVRVNEPK